LNTYDSAPIEGEKEGVKGREGIDGNDLPVAT
jgi:hypothetical protein